MIGGLRIKLAGISPPQDGLSCGQVDCVGAATHRLQALLAGGPVGCIKERRLGHGVYAGRCRLDDGSDPAEVLLRDGLARIGESPPAAYVAAVEAAMSARRGLWAAGSF